MSYSQNQPPTKASLLKWWNQFTSQKKDDKHTATPPDHPVFGRPLRESLRYASVQISTANTKGELYVWGYIPVVVAKCGLYLKETATEVAGTFRVNGSTRRMRELQAAFETPPRYGKSLDWKNEHYTTHDVASVFRRYLTQMPESVIPHDKYHDFRDALSKSPFNHDNVINTYRRLIQSMPPANQYLLLYVLDLLSVFARKSDKNLMTATNLAVIFRPGLISHPNHELEPKEHQLSQQVLEFLIAQQDWFLLDIAPPLRDGDWREGRVERREGEREGKEGREVEGEEEEWDKVRRVVRRRTMVEHADSTPHGLTSTNPLSPVTEAPSPSPSSAVSPLPSNPGSPNQGQFLSQSTGSQVRGVTRSRTMPSRRGRDEGSGSEEERRRILRKQKQVVRGG